MSYPGVGKRDWINKKALVDHVNANYLDFLVKIPAFQMIIAKDDSYQKEWRSNAKRVALEKEMIAIQKDPRKQAGEYAMEYLEWKTEVNQLKGRYEAAEADAAKSWANDWLIEG